MTKVVDLRVERRKTTVTRTGYEPRDRSGDEPRNHCYEYYYLQNSDWICKNIRTSPCCTAERHRQRWLQVKQHMSNEASPCLITSQEQWSPLTVGGAHSTICREDLRWLAKYSNSEYNETCHLSGDISCQPAVEFPFTCQGVGNNRIVRKNITPAGWARDVDRQLMPEWRRMLWTTVVVPTDL
jgi:hypothetical protein